VAATQQDSRRPDWAPGHRRARLTALEKAFVVDYGGARTLLLLEDVLGSRLRVSQQLHAEGVQRSRDRRWHQSRGWPHPCEAELYSQGSGEVANWYAISLTDFAAFMVENGERKKK
jgi:hypothetical protein